MSPEDRFVFDCQGYLRLRAVLAHEQVAALSRVIDERGARIGAEASAEAERTIPDVVAWGGPFQELIDHPRILPCLRATLGPRFRLDHDYAIVMRRGGARGPLHGGQGGMDDWWYRCRDGIIRTGMVVVMFALTPARCGDGGFCCVPGSHKSGLVRVPEREAHLLEAIPEDVRGFARVPDYVAQPEIEAGDAVVFTEALVHGTSPWTGAHERRVVLLKFTPGHACAKAPHYRAEQFTALSERQRLILAPPSLYDRPEVP